MKSKKNIQKENLRSQCLERLFDGGMFKLSPEVRTGRTHMGKAGVVGGV